MGGCNWGFFSCNRGDLSGCDICEEEGDEERDEFFKSHNYQDYTAEQFCGDPFFDTDG